MLSPSKLLTQAPWLRIVTSTILFLLALYGYALLIEASGGFWAGRFFEQWFELGLVAYLYLYLYLILKPRRWRPLLAGLPVLLVYMVQDIFYHFYGKVFRIIEVLELPELLQVLPLSYSVPMVLMFLLPLLWLLASINYRKQLLIITGSLPLLMTIYLLEFMPQSYATLIENNGNQITTYSDGISVENNGRLTMLFYREAKRVEALAATQPYRNRDAYEQEADQFATELKQHSNQRNVHLIVLESFLDPTLFKKVSFSKDPLHPDFRALFGDRLGLSISPVFGGGTAQAEFEVLCGIPALEQLTSVEFNIFTGKAAECLPGILNRLDYRTVATNAYRPNFFNAIPAYKGAGFDETYFPREYAGSNPSYYSNGDDADDDFIFDGSLFAQNLAFVEKHLQEHPGQPLVNYIMTVYGHTPHILAPNKRPELIKLIADHQDEHLQRSVNQFYYRTQAIAAYVRKLVEIDPEGLIILVSDHVPPLVYGPITYQKLEYLNNSEELPRQNRLMIIEHGQPKLYHTPHHYELNHVVYNYISGGDYCRNHGCPHLKPESAIAKGDYLEQYLRLMAHASE